MSEIDLRCGDVLDILPALRGRDFAAVITDPPYCSGGMQNAGRTRVKMNASYNPSRSEWIVGDTMSTEVYREWMRSVLRGALDASCDGAQAFVFTDWRMFSVVQYAGEAAGWTTAQMVVWEKPNQGNGHFWMNAHELVWCGFKHKRLHPRNTGQRNIWRGHKPRDQLHPNAKPVELVRYLLRGVAVDGAVLDPFMGSGSVGVAARLAGRGFVGIDVDGRWIEEARVNVLNASPEARQTSLEVA